MRSHVAVVLLASSLLACESVPDISFDGDAASDGGASNDAVAVGDSTTTDGPPTVGCLDGGGGTPPDGGICCLNGSPCVGVNCSVTNCAYCAMHCSAMMPICCTKMGGSNPQCKPTVDKCP